MTARKEGRRAVMKEFFPNGMTRKKTSGFFPQEGLNPLLSKIWEK
jgi:hypothetical protein